MPRQTRDAATRVAAMRKVLSDPAVRAAIRANHHVARMLRAERAAATAAKV